MIIQMEKEITYQKYSLRTNSRHVFMLVYQFLQICVEWAAVKNDSFNYIEYIELYLSQNWFRS